MDEYYDYMQMSNVDYSNYESSCPSSPCCCVGPTGATGATGATGSAGAAVLPELPGPLALRAPQDQQGPQERRGL